MENETRTVQKYRHAARKSLTEARERLALRTDETYEVYRLLNGQISDVLQGVAGLSQETQVERLNTAKEKVEAGLTDLPAKVAAAKDSVLALIEDWEQSITEKAQEAITTLEEAATYAAERDFEAHQQAKQERKYAPAMDYDESDEDDDEDDEDVPF